MILMEGWYRIRIERHWDYSPQSSPDHPSTISIQQIEEPFARIPLDVGESQGDTVETNAIIDRSG